MKTDEKILIAFVLNLVFSIFEFIGGVFTGSVAIVSDAIHDLGDATSIGISYFLEHKSKKPADGIYTYGYSRYSILASVVVIFILIFGSCAVIYNGVLRFFNPVAINYNGMIIFALVGFFVNLLAAFFTRGEGSINQKAVNLHMIEDVLGWTVALLGAIVMKFTNISIIDPIMSIGVAVFILINAVKQLKKIVDLFLEKIPDGVSISDIKKHICAINGVLDVHHIHVWSMDEHNNCATMHVVTDVEDTQKIKSEIKEELKKRHIIHATLELERSGECCEEEKCTIKHENHGGCCHHRHHHH